MALHVHRLERGLHGRGQPAGADDKFMTAGLVDPTVTVPAGARVSVRLVNADTTSAQRLVFAAAGAHTATLAFTASRAGSYRYLCPVPGHAQAGMAGEFVVSG